LAPVQKPFLIALTFTVLQGTLATVASGADVPLGNAVTAPAGGGQGVISASVLGAAIAYRACAQTPCSVASGDPTIALPVDTSPQNVKIESLSIGQGRHALWAHAPSFGALLASVPSSHEVRVLWSGVLGFAKGEEGERSGEFLEVTEPDTDGSVHVLVGEIREDVTICGRRSLLSPKVLDAKDLAFKSARVQRLRRDERDRAPLLVAVPSTTPAATPLGRVLQGASASSGIGGPAALTDGDLETTWSEKRGGDGNGEFVQMNAPEQVEITSVSFVARPPTQDVPKGAAPRKIWLATPDSLFSVTFPDDPWARAGASYEVRFSSPIRTRCLAVVLDEAYVKPRTPEVDVTLAEVTAHTEFDTNADPVALAGALAGGQDRAKMAAAILSRSGDRAYDAVEQVYPTLDDRGRVLALEIIDNAPCAKSATLYVQAMDVGRPGEVHHATDRLTRCGRDAAPALSVALKSGTDVQKVRAANLLALVAPDVAIHGVVAVMASAKPEVRAEFRAALTKAAQSPAAKDAISTQLGNADLPAITAIDLLRAATARQGAVAGAAGAFARLATADADFRTRYLLLGPAVALAKGGETRAEDFVLRAVTADTDSHVRARAAEVSSELPKALEPLEQATRDADPRVRDAAASSLARLVDPKGAKVQPRVWPASLFPSIASLLEADPFPFVRAHAADALAFAPAGDVADKPLDHALEDASPVVRARAVETLGRRGSIRYAGDIRERLDDEAEILDVRIRAARALGRICDAKSADRLTDLAQQIATVGARGEVLVIGAAAASALGRLNPPDLPRRLAPLSDQGAPRVAQEIAKSALATVEHCR
jgi:HEAT repeat protein